MKPGGQHAGDRQPESIEFVPKRELDRVQQENDRLRKENERLKQETERLGRELEAALRARPHHIRVAHQKPTLQRPGRRYGRQSCRTIPVRVDERITVPLPERCPHCGGGVGPESCAIQYQEEIVRRSVVRRVDIAVGRCHECQRRVQGRHRLQTSDAVAVGSVQLGPEALTLAAILNKQMGYRWGTRDKSCLMDSGWRSVAEGCAGHWHGWRAGQAKTFFVPLLRSRYQPADA
jgi:hypothetical protein